MNINGIIIGAVTFVIIGIFHPIVIKGEYYFGHGIWPLFLIAGIGVIGGSFFVENVILSACLGVLGFTCLWSIRELFEQRKRVKKGWYPKKPEKDK